VSTAESSIAVARPEAGTRRTSGSLLGSELIKLRSTRATLALVGSALALVLVIVAAIALTADPRDVSARDALQISTLVQAFALVLGALAITTEFRHGTITPTLLIAPRRVRVLAAKLAVYALAALALGLLAAGLSAAIALPALDARGIAGGDMVEIVVGIGLGTALYAALGLGVGALVRNQVGAIVGLLAFTFVVEPLVGIIPDVGDDVARYLPGAAANALSGTVTGNGGDLLGQVPGGLVLLGWAVAFLVAGALALRSRDIGG
jgi:ABC-2 type transport system permease protein